MKLIIPGRLPCMNDLIAANRLNKYAGAGVKKKTQRQIILNGRRVKEPGEPSFTVTAQDRHGVMLSDGRTCCIRKLTPKECWRLQGFTDNQYEKAAAVNSKSQLYKQAGNAVTVNVTYEVGKHIVNFAKGEDDE